MEEEKKNNAKDVPANLTCKLTTYLNLAAYYHEKAVEVNETIKKYLNGEYETD